MKKLVFITSTFLILGICNTNAQGADQKKIQKNSEEKIVISVHEWELKEGVNEAEFEIFIQKKLVPLYDKAEGQKMKLMKGDRGKRIEKYALFLIFDSIEARDRIYPPSGGISEEFEKILEGTDEIWEQLGKYTEGDPFGNHTDYFSVIPQ